MFAVCVLVDLKDRNFVDGYQVYCMGNRHALSDDNIYP